MFLIHSGLDIVPLLEKLGVSETVIHPFRSSGVGHFAVAFLLYKLAAPARYTVTIVGTRVTVNFLRKRGYMKTVPQENSIRQLVRDGRTQIKDRTDVIKEKTSSQLKQKTANLRSRSKNKS